MSSPRQIKKEKVTRFQDQAGKALAIVIADYKGLSVSAMEDLRIKVRETGGNVVIIKNTLADIALKNLGMKDLEQDLSGQIAFIFSTNDAVTGTKAAYEFAKRNTEFKVVSGFFDGRRISLEEVRALAVLPTKDELKSMFVAILLAPMVDLAGTLTAPLQEFVGTLDAKAAKMEEEAA